MSRNRFAAVATAMLLGGAAGCASSTAQVAQPKVTVAPAASTVMPGGVIDFSAVVLNLGSSSVTWGVQTGGGSIDATGVFTASSALGTYTITATSVAESSVHGTASVTISSGPTGTTVAISPRAITLGPGGVTAFTCTVANNANMGCAFSVQEGSAGGTITAAGNYTAPASVGTWHVIATSTAVSSATDIATVTVAQPAISVAPAVSTVMEGGTIDFAATVTNLSNSSVTWAVQSGGGSIAASGASGVFTASSTPGTYTITATSVALPSLQGTASVTISAAPITTVAISPRAIALSPSAATAFTCTVTNNANPACTFSVQEGAAGGAVTAGGAYTAPSVVGTFHVIATSSAVSSATDTAVVTVTQPNTGATNEWDSISLPGADMNATLTCGNYGATGVVVDPLRPANLYITVNCQGIWKSVDFGATWTGPINTGTGGIYINGAGAISIASEGANKPPALMMMFKRDYQGAAAYNGYFLSLDDGVSWTHYPVSNASGTAIDGQYHDFYHTSVDPYDSNHLLASGHEQNLVVESTDQGHTWSVVPLNSTLTAQSSSTAMIYFIDTGSASTTRTTFLYISQTSGGTYGTWRTTNSGGTWTMVEKNEHVAGDESNALTQTGGGVMYLAGQSSAHGDGVLKSTDYGQTWTHLGPSVAESNVWVTQHNLYATFGFAIGANMTFGVNYETASQPGTGTWTQPANAMPQGPVGVAVTNDGTHNIFVVANFNGGVWRYIESSQ